MMYDDLAVRIASTYGLALFAMRGQYLTLRAPGVEVTPFAIKALSEGLRTTAETFEHDVHSVIESYYDQLTADASETLAGELMVQKRLLFALIRRALAENIAQVMQTVRAGRLDFSKLLKDAHGGMGALVQAHMARIAFKVTDLSGRRWDAEKAMRFTVREFAYQAYVSVALEVVADAGDLAQVSYADSGRDFVLSISGDAPGYPSLADVRKATFHPNATATVEPYVPA